MDFELSHWDGRRQNFGLSAGPRYTLDTVLYHEQNTNGLFKAHKFMELIKGNTVLEIGCNGGGLTMLYAQDDRHVVGLDLLYLPLKFAKKYSDLINKEDFSKESWGESWCHPPSWKINSDWVQSEGSQLPFANNSIWTICFPDVIEHFPKHLRQSTVSECYRIIKPGGRLLLSALVDVNDPKNPNWRKEMETDIHPFGLPSEEDLDGYIANTDFSIFYRNVEWFGNDKFYRQYFIGVDKSN